MSTPAFERVQMARHPDRPYAMDLFTTLFTEFVEIHGDRRFADDPAMITGFAKLDGQEVKTNREYTAMLHEIETAQNDIRTREDRILEIMMETDELNAAIKKGEGELKTAEKEIAAERAVLDSETAGLQAEIDKTTAERGHLVAEIDRHVLAIFETTAKGRKGVAVAEAKDGLCTICHVRLRPQVFNEVRKNEQIIQCDSCRRILYFAGNSEASAPVSQM